MRLTRNLEPVTDMERAAAEIVRRLHEAGHQGYMVGGAVRDRLLARHPKDVDVATDARPERVQKLFPRTHAVGAAFGVVLVRMGDLDIEVATFRIERGYRDGRRPDVVDYATAEEDAWRRDFTVNALFYDAVAGEVVDHVGGLADLDRGVLRAIGDPHKRFAEDHLRMLRAVRFACSLGFALDEKTADAIRDAAPAITRISAERIHMELTRMLTGPRPHRAMAMLDDLQLLHHILPEVSAMKGVPQPPQFHPEGDVWIHTLLLLELMVHPPAVLAWACLLHDVGKPPTFARREDGRETFPCHAAIGADMTADILRRLRASRRFTDDVRALVETHMTFAHVKEMRVATLRRLMARPTFDLELELHRIDCSASSGWMDNYLFLLDKLHEVANTPKLPEPLLTGRDVLAHAIPAGPAIGRILEEARELQLNGTLSSREGALAWLAGRAHGEKG